MLRHEAISLAVFSLIVAGIIVAMFKELVLVAFDSEFALAHGFAVRAIDLAILGLVLAVAVIGLRVVGLILIVALLVIPPAAARFWTNRAGRMTAVSALIGAASAYFGAAVSAVHPHTPTGAIIVLVAFALLIFSVFFGGARGLVPRAVGWSRMRTREAAP